VTAARGGVSAIVTGGTRGLGFAIAKAMAAGGASVVINGRSEEVCLKAMAAIGVGPGQITHVAGNVAEESVAEALVDHYLESFGHVNLVVKTARASPPTRA
jgi:NAD(P)-dependent dehydrogenase (short-subunit alcohol dehydrogenase family)